MDAFDKVCPRCQGKGSQAPVAAAASPTPVVAATQATAASASAATPVPAATQTLDTDSSTDSQFIVSRNVALYVGAVAVFCIGYLSPWVSLGFLGISANGGVGLEFIFVLAAMASAGLAYYERQADAEALGSIRFVIAAASLIFAAGELVYFLMALKGQSLGFGLPLMFLGACGMVALAYNDTSLPRKLPSALATGAVLFIILGWAGYNGNQLSRGGKMLPTLGGNYEAPGAKKASCQSNLKQIAIACFQYMQDNNEMFPDLSSPSTIKAALSHYAASPEIFLCPGDEAQYLGNVSQSRRSLAVVSTDTIILYDANNTHDGGRNVAFADGRVRLLSAEEWARESVKSGIR